MPQLSYTHKNKLLIACTIVFFFFLWFLALKPTIDAAALNSQLRETVNLKANLGFNPQLYQRKAVDMRQVINRFKVDSVLWRDEFWLKVSNIAYRKGLEVEYKTPVSLPDSNGIMLNQRIEFKGNYRDLMVLLDSVEKVEGVGHIVNLKFYKPDRQQSDKSNNRIRLLLNFYAVSKDKLADTGVL